MAAGWIARGVVLGLLGVAGSGCTLLMAMGVLPEGDVIAVARGTWRAVAEPIELFDKEGNRVDAVAVRIVSGPLPTDKRWNPTAAEAAALLDRARPILIGADYQVVAPAVVPVGEEIRITGAMRQTGYAIRSGRRTYLTRVREQGLLKECAIVVTEIRRGRGEVVWQGPEPGVY